MLDRQSYWTRNLRDTTTRRRLLKGSLLGLAGLSTAALLGCGDDDDGGDSGDTGTSGQPVDGGIYEEALSGPLNVFPDFQKSTTFSDARFAYDYVYNYILRWDTQGLASADLAGLPEVAEGGTRLTFTYKDGIKWHQKAPTNGRAFTSEDAKKNIERIQNPATVSPRRTNYASIASLETPDAKTLVIKLKEPDAPILSNLGFYDMVIPMEQSTGAAQFRVVADVAGTGPYTWESYDEVSGLVHKKRPDGYWKAGKAHLDEHRVTILGTGTGSTTYTNNVNALRSNRADFGQIDLEVLKDFQSDSRFRLLSIPYDGKTMLVMNHNRDPYKDARVRHAMSLAIDRRLIYQNIWAGEGSIIGPISSALGYWAVPESELKTFPGYKENRDTDLREAQQLMSAAGQSSGFSDSMINGGGTNTSMAELIVPMLAKINIRAEIRTLQNVAAFVAPLAEGNFTLANGTVLPGIEPDSQLSLFHLSTGSRNYGKFNDPQIDPMLIAARRELNQERRKTMYLDIQRYLLRNQTTNFAWLNTYTNIFAQRTYVKAPAITLQYWGPHYSEDLFLEGKS
jgi:peptide/nickel transport system substrate-binding protein